MTLTDTASIAAIEITKVSSFLAFIEKNAPGVGSLAGFTSQLTQEIKKQIETTGNCPLIGVFEQVSCLEQVFVLS